MVLSSTPKKPHSLLGAVDPLALMEAVAAGEMEWRWRMGREGREGGMEGAAVVA